MTDAVLTKTGMPQKKNRIANRLGLLRARHADLDAHISEEVCRTRPDMLRVQFLKRARLRTKDEITYLAGVLRTIGRPSEQSAA